MEQQLPGGSMDASRSLGTPSFSSSCLSDLLLPFLPSQPFLYLPLKHRSCEQGVHPSHDPILQLKQHSLPGSRTGQEEHHNIVPLQLLVHKHPEEQHLQTDQMNTGCQAAFVHLSAGQ
uniref:Small nuclear ribonucleoprotein LSM1 n=1 Tax=Arundo donax TaxID=35708 RepID=A0A0A9EY19_ARUDO